MAMSMEEVDLPPAIGEDTECESDDDVELFLPSDIESNLPDDEDVFFDCEDMDTFSKGSESVNLPSDIESEECECEDEVAMAPEPCQESKSGPPSSLRVPSPNALKLFVKEFEENFQKYGSSRLGMELYSPPRVLKMAAAGPVTSNFGLFSFDIVNGWDFDDIHLRKLTLDCIQRILFFFVFLSPPCTMFSELQRLFNRKKADPVKWERRMKQALVYIFHSMQAAKIQISRNRFFMFEHPQKASSWRLPMVEEVASMPGVQIISFDMCACGMVSPLGEPIRKRTKLMTNHPGLATEISKYQCCKKHKHRAIEGSELGHSLSKWAQVYPDGLVTVLAKAMLGQ